MPVISGIAQSGSKLTTTFGSWTQSPSGYAYQWKADDADLIGATSRSYTLTDAEVGKTITVTVTATNSFGSASATSAATSAVLAKPVTVAPINVVAPVVTGNALVGSILMVSDGTWANSPTSYGYQWFKNGTALSGATANIFALLIEDFGAIFSAQVTATNAIGSTNASTNNAGPVSQTPPANTTAPAITGTAQVDQTLTGSNGTWSNDPTSFTYQWTRNSVDILGENDLTYTLVEADIDQMIGFKVTASNSGGSTTASATSVGPIVALSMKINIVAEGDSLTDGSGTTDPATKNYPYVAMSALSDGPEYTLDNISTGGIKADDISNNFDSRGAAAFDVEADLNVFTLLAGSNDRGSGASYERIYRDLRKILRKAKDAGYQRRLIGTIISDDTGDPPYQEWSANDIELTQYIRDYWNSDLDADGLFDLAADSHFDEVSDTFDTLYYNSDRVHPTDLGSSVLASIYAPALNTAIATPAARVELPATWFELDKSSNLQLTNSNRTVNWPAPGFANANVRGARGKASGKWYFETQIDLSNMTAVGLMNLDFADDIAADWVDPCESPNAIGYSSWTGNINHNASAIVTMGSISDSDVIALAVDLDTRSFWMRINEGPWNGGAPEGAPTIDPATGVGGIDISMLGTGMIYPVGFIYEAGQITSRFAATEFTGQIPTGFTALG
ncbi:GDSL-type esterase/lipase family protein [Rhizobium mongolense]|nr:GDSL-type esterase/lipase family protein [Rhizobium mongolense]MBB4230057.1 lysophospholipase L1-like esterase [Rhizobium mongolense]